MASVKEKALEVASQYANAWNRDLDDCDVAAVQAGATETLLTLIAKMMSRAKPKEEILDFIEISEDDYDRLYYFFDFFDKDEEAELNRQRKLPILEKAEAHVQKYCKEHRNEAVQGLLEAAIFMIADKVYDYVSDEDLSHLKYFFEFDHLKDDDCSIRGLAIHAALIYQMQIKDAGEKKAWQDALCYAYEAAIVKTKLGVVIRMLANNMNLQEIRKYVQVSQQEYELLNYYFENR